ncbi:MAG: hypothetical protein WAM89_02230 [Terriglobales bacterium]
MAKRKLRIVKQKPTLAVCERCSSQFRVTDSEIQVEFDTHDCKPLDSSQNALRIVREATEGK